MKIFTTFFVLVLTLCGAAAHADELNTDQEVLFLLEECYDSLSPAQEKGSGAFVWVTGIPHSRYNIITHLATDEVEKRVSEIVDRAPSGLPLSFWHHPLNQAKELPEVLVQKGFKLYGKFYAGFWIVEPVKLESDWDIQPAENMDEFHEILAATLHYDSQVKEGFAKLLSGPAVENYLIFHNGKAIGTGTLWHKGKKGVLMNVMVLPEYQRHGAGKAMSRHIMKRAHELGLQLVVGRSSLTAAKIYGDLGFKKTYDIEVYTRTK